jgi:hypothetical protein
MVETRWDGLVWMWILTGHKDVVLVFVVERWKG